GPCRLQSLPSECSFLESGFRGDPLHSMCRVEPSGALNDRPLRADWVRVYGGFLVRQVVAGVFFPGKTRIFEKGGEKTSGKLLFSSVRACGPHPSPPPAYRGREKRSGGNDAVGAGGVGGGDGVIGAEDRDARGAADGGEAFDVV